MRFGAKTGEDFVLFSQHSVDASITFQNKWALGPAIAALKINPNVNIVCV